MLYLCNSAHLLNAPQRLEEGIGIGVTYSCEQPCRCWESSLGSLEEQPALPLLSHPSSLHFHFLHDVLLTIEVFLTKFGLFWLLCTCCHSSETIAKTKVTMIYSCAFLGGFLWFWFLNSDL